MTHDHSHDHDHGHRHEHDHAHDHDHEPGHDHHHGMLWQSPARRLKELEKIQANLKPEAREQVRLSTSEPEARFMKHGDGAKVPSYNQQVSTDADSGVIVGVHVSQAADDSHELAPSMEQIEKNLGRMPEKVTADGGFTNRDSIGQMEEKKIDFYGSLPDPKERSEAAVKSHGIYPQFAPHFFILQPETRTAVCPAGQTMKYLRRHQKRGNPCDHGQQGS